MKAVWRAGLCELAICVLIKRARSAPLLNRKLFRQENGDKPSMGWYFAFFLISGFCSILYEIVWLRLAMAQFGVTSALVSIVLSAFMAGLGLGSWASGWLMRRFGDRAGTLGL